MTLSTTLENLTARIYEILDQVTDPEIPVITIRELGILRDIQIGEDQVIHVYITPTYGGCPAMDMITVQIKAALEDAGFRNTLVHSILSPAWTTDWISEEGMRKLKEYGIAPPVEKTTDKSFLMGQQKTVPCPLCNSEHTELVSLFGSTACKSLYKCLDCLEPFDYFKCH